MNNQLSESKRDIEHNVIDGLSRLIHFHLLNASYQQYTPDSDPDKSDATIADACKKAEALIKLRNDFEDIITGIIPF